VLVLDNELHPETLAKRYHTVLAARGVMLDTVAEDLEIVTMRGRLMDLTAIARYCERFAPGYYAVIVIDALYRALPEGTDENSNSQMARVYDVLNRIADRLRVVLIVVHHSSKGVQGNKSVTDTGSGAGAMSRATDTHLILREHEEKDCVVLEAAARSFAPIAPLCLQWVFPVWRLAPELDPTKLRRDRPARRPAKTGDETDTKIVWTAETFAAKFLTRKPATQSSIVVAASAEKLSERKAKMLLEAAVDDGIVHRWSPHNPTHPLRFATEPQPLIEGAEPAQPRKRRGRK
jgi:hypothetical protein